MAVNKELQKLIPSLDNLGIVASVICLIHCMAMPFILALLPFMGLSFLDTEEAHWVLAFFIIGFALVAIFPAYLNHKRPGILSAMIVGMLLVVFGAFFAEHTLGHAYEMPLLVVGNLILVATHWRNRSLIKCCDHEH
jgi:type III secretory pathway component EscS